MSDLKWIKLEISLFENEKIKLIEANYKRQFDSVIVTWIRLLCLAGKQNNGGKFLITDEIPYKIETFSKLWNMRKDKVNSIFNILIEFDMLEFEDNIYFIKNWNVYQSTDKWEKKKAYDREYHRAKREKEKIEEQELNNDGENVVRLSNDCRMLDIDKNKNKNKNNNIYSNTNCLLGYNLNEKNDWCYKKCIHCKECKVNDTTLKNGKKVAPVPDWWLKAEKEDKERRKELENK